ncbi:phenylalanine--tRNA ligase subunit beta [Thermogymnomonas acidicola]|uniref:phenylalanine--tRNA ligase n=1 Tax=Thermogymnomonas acidicola TaxID=399579 RepID=A0AA37F9I8_9ARCH|nr:phenylalanine--tRNA ligase subunit beta [Thermogymnomonas acidicola]GGM73403.1 phenylalanine--tRNA ligase subunit beta [Thermogymnomonas acidicola]
MVVIRASGEEILNTLGEEGASLIEKFASVIGYSVEADAEGLRVEFNPDRPDLFSLPTLARAIRTYHGDDAEYKVVDGHVTVYVDRSVAPYRGNFACFVARGNPIGGNLRALIDYQERLHESIGKDRVKAAIGLHDLSKVSPPFTYRGLRPDETVFTTYDGSVTGTPESVVREHEKGRQYGGLLPPGVYLGIVDSTGGILSLPPMVNGSKSRVDEGTREFFIDITGTEDKAVKDAMHLLAFFFLSLGYSLERCKVSGGSSLAGSFREMEVSGREVKRIIGTEVNGVCGLLRRFGYRCEEHGNSAQVGVPPWRVDVMGPVDIIEDVAKSMGYDSVPETVIMTGHFGNPQPQAMDDRMLRELMVSLGYQEVMTFVVTSQSLYSGRSYRGGVEVVNPKSLDFSVVRDRIYLNLLDFVSRNRRYGFPQKLFEIGDVVVGGRQEHRLSCVAVDTKGAFSEVMRAYEVIRDRFLGGTARIREREVEDMIPGRSGSVRIGDLEIGLIGEVHPETLDGFQIQYPAAVLEIRF